MESICKNLSIASFRLVLMQRIVQRYTFKVNEPLYSDESHREDRAVHTIYPNQCNRKGKVNAIKGEHGKYVSG